MGRITKVMVALGLLVPALAQATPVWSSCQTITGVANYLSDLDSGYNGFFLSLSPGISGCGIVTAGGVGFIIGQQGITASNFNSYLAMSLTAYTSGHQVTIWYDSSSSSCYSAILVLGGNSGQCP